jgi:hypothetical protein
VRVDFYRLETPATGQAAKAALARVLALPKDKSRTLHISGVPFRAQELTVAEGVWRGDMERIRMDDVPVIADLDGSREEINLDKDQGIGEDTAFRYDEKTQVLAIQAHRSGMSASRWGYYFGHFSENDVALVPIAIARLDADDSISRLTRVQKVHVRVAGIVNSGEAVNRAGATPKQLRRLADGAPQVDITFTAPGRGGSLPVAAAKAALHGLYKSARTAIIGDDEGGEEQIDRIDVVGTLDEDSRFDNNLLQFLMRDNVKVKVHRKSRRMIYADRIKGIESAFAKRAPELTKYYVKGG